MDLDEGEGRPYTQRVDEAAAAGAQTIAVACTFCYQMLLDGLKARDMDETMKVRDVVSIIRESLGV